MNIVEQLFFQHFKNHNIGYGKGDASSVHLKKEGNATKSYRYKSYRLATQINNIGNLLDEMLNILPEGCEHVIFRHYPEIKYYSSATHKEIFPKLTDGNSDAIAQIYVRAIFLTKDGQEIAGKYQADEGETTHFLK